MKKIKKFEDTKKELLIDLLWYLKENKYEQDETLVFLEIFKSIYEHSDEHIALEPYLEGSNDFARRIVKDWEKTGKINFVRDINSKHFLSKVKSIPYPFNNSSYGYVKNNDGKYIPSSNPTYFCSPKGFYDDNNHTINILFDEVERANGHEVTKCLSHETIHTEQDKFGLFWYIMNIDYSFSRMLVEGHTMKVARRMESNSDNLSRIPFAFDKDHSLFLNFTFHDYDICKYLYFKLEFLLGYDFMNMLMVGEEQLTFLSKARRKIDEKYGNGTFKYLYKNIQLILLLNITYSYNTQLFEATVEGKEKEQEKYGDRKSIIYMLHLKNKIRKNFKLLTSLSNEGLNYNKIKENLVSLYKEFYILTDIELYQDVIETDLEVCNAILNSNDPMEDITKCISNLECLMTDCLLKDATRYIFKNNDIDNVKERLNLYKHYVVDDKFNLPILQNAMNNINYISHLINESCLNNENKLIKKQ
jgi:hypothetical protein